LADDANDDPNTDEDEIVLDENGHEIGDEQSWSNTRFSHNEHEHFME